MRAKQLLLTRDFSLVWWGQVVAQVGDGVSKLALLWFVYSVTGSPLKTSIIGVLQTIPAIALAPLIGVAVDRFPKKTLLIASDLIRAVVIGLIPCWISGETFTVEYLYILVMLHAVATAVFGPALTAAIPSLVSTSQYTAANALLQSTTSLGIIMGPALSGMGIAFLSSKEVLCLNAATYVISAACFLPIRMAPPAKHVTRRSLLVSATRDIVEGLHYVVTGQPFLMFLTAIAAMYTCGTAAFTTLFPVFGRTLLDLGPVEVGYLWSVLGFGLLAVSLALTSISSWTVRKRIGIIAISSAVSGVALFGLGYVRHPVATGALLSLLGASIGALTPIAWGVMQELTPPTLLGRALSFYSLGAMGAAVSGITFFGWVTEQFGGSTTLMAIGAVMFLTAAMAVLLARNFREYPARSLVKPSPSETPIGQLPGRSWLPGQQSDIRKSPVESPGWRLLKTADFSLLFWGQLTSQIGDSLNRVALLWFVYQMTGSAMKMMVVGILQTIPPLLLSPFIGVFLDRVDKKSVMVWVDLARTVLVLLIPVLYAIDMLTLNRLYASIFVLALVSTLFGPALSAAVPQIVRRDQLTAANALLQSTANIGLLIGPLISGIGIALVGPQNVLYVNAATFFISALCLVRIHPRARATLSKTATGSGHWREELLAGVRFISVEHPTILNLVLATVLYSLATSAFSFMLPVFSAQKLNAGALEIGILWSALGAGMLISSSWLASLAQGDLAGRFTIIFRSMIIGGLAMCGLSLISTPLIAGAYILVIGGSTALFMPIMWGVLQEVIPDYLLGRVFSLFSIGSMASAMMGMAGFGWAADTLGPHVSVLGIGLIMLIGACVAALCIRRSHLLAEASCIPPLG